MSRFSAGLASGFETPKTVFFHAKDVMLSCKCDSKDATSSYISERNKRDIMITDYYILVC